jgi:Tfp pilus assembly PilM family ATPase
MKTLCKLLLALALALPALQVSAQAVRNVSGTIDEFMIDEHYMVVDGKRLVVNEGNLVITYKGEPVRPSLVSRGLTIFYSTSADGSVSEIVLVGPAARLDQINQH